MSFFLAEHIIPTPDSSMCNSLNSYFHESNKDAKLFLFFVSNILSVSDGVSSDSEITSVWLLQRPTVMVHRLIMSHNDRDLTY